MIVYNVTVKIEKDIHDDWLAWMKETHIPEVLKTNLFEDNNEYFRHIDGFVDHYHFSKKGHQYVADELKKVTEQQGWL